MSIEKELRQNWDDVVYPEPDVPEQPMLLAQAPTDQTVVSDAGAGRGSYAGYNPREAQLNLEPQAKMESYDPTVRQKIADFLQAGFEAFGTPRYQARKNAQTIMGGGSSNLPLNMGIADIIPFLGTALQTEEAVRTGGEAAQSLQAGQTGQAALQAGAAAVGMIPGAAATGKAVKSISSKLNRVAPKDIPSLFSHGTSEAGADAIMKSGKFDPSAGERSYTYSEFGRKAAYLTPDSGWWLDADRAANGRAITYDAAVTSQIDKKAKIFRVDNEQELNQLAKKAGFIDAYDMMSDLSVDSLDYEAKAMKVKSQTLEQFMADEIADDIESLIRNKWPGAENISSLEELNAFKKKNDLGFERTKEDYANNYKDYLNLDNVFAKADAATEKLIKAGIDGIYIGPDFDKSANNWLPASDQLAMFRPELVKPLEKKSLKSVTSETSGTTIQTSQQEPK